MTVTTPKTIRCWVDANRAGCGVPAAGPPKWVRDDYEVPFDHPDDAIRKFEFVNQQIAGLFFDGTPFDWNRVVIIDAPEEAQHG